MNQEQDTVRTRKNQFDFPLIIAAGILLLFGLFMILDASVVAAFRDFQDKYYYFKNQLAWAVLGSVALVVFSLVDYHKLLKISHLFLLLSIFLLVIVLIPQFGTEAYGARRWINLGGFSLQPSELTKLTIIFYTTQIISKFEKFKINLRDSLIVYFLPIALVTGLVVLEPDLGTATILMGITIIIYFVGRAPVWHFLTLLPPLAIATIYLIIREPYRLSRLKSFFDPSFDPQGASYHINQILSAIVSGGFLGVGIGASRSKFAFIPEVQTDAIFAIIVEELGFVGALLLISLFLFLISRAFSVARVAQDFEGKVLALGIAGFLSIQSLFNLASTVALVPLTGIPLPFISSGGSSLIITLSAIGILVNIGRQKHAS